MCVCMCVYVCVGVKKRSEGGGVKKRSEGGGVKKRRKLLPRLEEEEMLVGDIDVEAENLDQMSFCQFVKMYEGKGWQDMRKTNEEGEIEEPDDDKPEEGELAKEDDFNY